ncbi:MAG: S-layer homology domain-containing protein [Clostridia bacterium]|nr:S-layer homology domain-containing protein [Clostridia bacterium]
MKKAGAVSVILILTMIISLFTFAGAEYKTSEWAVPEVSAFEGEGLLPAGFPEDLTAGVNRAEFAALAVSVYEKCEGAITPDTGSRIFDDTDDINVLKAYKIGVVNGVSATEFMPERGITRQEMCTMMSRLMDALGVNAPVTMQYIYFDDGDDIADWADGAVQLMYKLGIVKGVSDSAKVAVIAPLSGATREQAAVMVWRLYKGYIAPDAQGGTQTQTVRTGVAVSENSRVAAGDYTSFYIDNTGVLYAWGRNDKYQLGLDVNDHITGARRVAQNVSAVAAAGSHGYYITGGTLYAFGDGETPHVMLENVRYVLAQRNRTYAITNGGALYAWGEGDLYTLGTGSEADVYTPVKVLDNVAKVSVSGGFASALTYGGDVYQWGDTRMVSALYGTDDIKNKTPALIMSGVRDISAGTSHLLMITNENVLYGWGGNFSGQIDPAHKGTRYDEPKLMETGVGGAWAGSEITFYTDLEQNLYTMGKNTGSRMGTSKVKADETADEPMYVTYNVEKLCINDNSVFAIKSNGALWSWGQNFNYRLGRDSENDSRDARQLMGETGELAFGFDHTLFLTTGERLYAWGLNEENQCGPKADTLNRFNVPSLYIFR